MSVSFEDKSIAKKLLTEIVSNPMQSTTIEAMYVLVEILENKLDPEPNEIAMVSTLYEIISRVKILESQLKNFVADDVNDHRRMVQLEDLYDRQEPIGSSKLVDY